MDETKHFWGMLDERGITREWVERTENEPDQTQDHEDGTRHFIKQIPEFDNRFLRVIINVKDFPNRRVTAFFDRRLRRKHESKSR